MTHKVEVAVYHFRGPHDCDELQGAEPTPFGVLSFHLDLVATVEVAAAGLSPEEVAARAWIESVGRQRHEYLVCLNAPQAIVDAQISMREVAAELSAAPQGMNCDGWAFIYGCRAGHCESWLMLIDSEWSPDAREPHGTSRSSRPAPRSLLENPAADCSAALRSLWPPPLN
jgi:hypothetical protein